MIVLRQGAVFRASSMCGDPKSNGAFAGFDRGSRLLFDSGQPYSTRADPDEIAREVAKASFQVIWRKIDAMANSEHLTLLATTQKS